MVGDGEQRWRRGRRARRAGGPDEGNWWPVDISRWCKRTARDAGLFLSPAILDVTGWSTTSADEEYFGPLLLVIRASSRRRPWLLSSATCFGLCCCRPDRRRRGAVGPVPARRARRGRQLNRPTTGASSVSAVRQDRLVGQPPAQRLVRRRPLGASPVASLEQAKPAFRVEVGLFAPGETARDHGGDQLRRAWVGPTHNYAGLSVGNLGGGLGAQRRLRSPSRGPPLWRAWRRCAG